jgi:hypothetical protein
MVNGGLWKIWKERFVAYFSVIFQRSHGMAEIIKNILRNVKRIPPEYKYKAILLH